MKKKYFKPKGILSKYVDRYYIIERSEIYNFQLPKILPGTGLELIFHINNSLSINNEVLDKAHIICPRKIFKFDKTNSVSYLSVRFKSGAFRHFNAIPYNELNDKYLSVNDIWKNKGSELLNELNREKLTHRRIKIIEHFLLKQLLKHNHYDNEKWDKIIATLYEKFNSITINELSEKTNLSHRQFERSFKNQFGITAKKFQRITRLQDITKKILLKKSSNLMDAILECGYYDQSHFINEFKEFIKLTPSEYFISDTFDNNFYFDSINKVSIKTCS